MASILLKSIVLKFRQMTYRPSDDFVEVDSVHERYQVNKQTKERSDVLDGWNIDFISIKGQIQTCKLPNDETVKAVVDKIQDALSEGKIVKVKFGTPSTFVAKIYEMLDGNHIRSGVSAVAKKVEIVAIESPTDDDFDDESVLI